MAAEAYDRFMGRFSSPLAIEFVRLLEPQAGQRALDVGCGPGALTAVLVDRLGADAVTAVDPAESFVQAAQKRMPGVDVRSASAERLPFDDDRFDLTLAQLVVHFMADPIAALREMLRVTKPSGLVAATVWDHADGGGPLTSFWDAVHRLDPDARGEGGLTGAAEGQLGALFREVGLRDVETPMLSVTVPFGTFEDWWAPFELGVGPAGAYVAALDDHGRSALRAQCADLLPTPPFRITASAWCAVGRA